MRSPLWSAASLVQVVFTVVIPVHPAVREVGWRLALGERLVCIRSIASIAVPRHTKVETR
jgi:hypothetical protein